MNPRHARRHAGLALVAVLVMAGCDLVTYRPPVGRDFGHPYAVRAGVLVALAPGVVVATPAVDADRRLFAVVEYEGGCREHTFAIASDPSADDQTFVWLVHDDGGDRCEELVRDTVAVDLGTAYRPGRLTLEIPNGQALQLTSLAGGG